MEERHKPVYTLYSTSRMVNIPNGAVIGKRIERLRERRKWSQRTLAVEAKVSHSYIRLLEKGGVASPGADKLDRIAHVLGWPDYHAMMASDELPPPLTQSDDNGEKGSIFRGPAGVRTTHERQAGQAERAEWWRVYAEGVRADPLQPAVAPHLFREVPMPAEQQEHIGKPETTFGITIRDDRLAQNWGITVGDICWFDSTVQRRRDRELIATRDPARGLVVRVLRVHETEEGPQYALSMTGVDGAPEYPCEEDAILGVFVLAIPPPKYAEYRPSSSGPADTTGLHFVDTRTGDVPHAIRPAS